MSDYEDFLAEAKIKKGIERDFLRPGIVGTINLKDGCVERDKVKANTLTVNRLMVGGSGNDEDTLDIWQGETDTQIFRLRSKSINHKITQGGGEGYDWGTKTNCYYYMRKKDVKLGGVHCNSFTEATQDIAYELYAVYGNANNAKDGNANGPINLAALRADPANNGYQACENNDNLLVLKTKPFGKAYKAVHIWDEDGNYYYDGALAAFQDEDDAQLLRDLEDILSGKISKAKMKEKDVFKKHKIVHVNEVDEEEIYKNRTRKTGNKRLDRFINIKKLNMLLIGHNLDLEKRVKALEAKL